MHQTTLLQQLTIYFHIFNIVKVNILILCQASTNLPLLLCDGQCAQKGMEKSHVILDGNQENESIGEALHE